MKTLLFILIMTPPLSSPKGYIIYNGKIKFIYPSWEENLDVIVSGNFNKWSNGTAWKMYYVKGEGYILEKGIQEIRDPAQSFYEFTFRVNSQLTDADDKAPNTIHCAGYGSRYLIQFQ